jgi:serine/threonine protein kinase
MSLREISILPQSGRSSTPKKYVELSRKLREAVNKTVEGISDPNERLARRFLSSGELKDILNTEALKDLFTELSVGHITSEFKSDIPQTNPDNTSEDGRLALQTMQTTVNNYVERTTGVPSRQALLALFLYRTRKAEELLSIFWEWLKSEHIDIPSDDSMPFTEQSLSRFGIKDENQDYILADQFIFKPITIRDLQHHIFSSRDKLPFIGVQEPIKKGSSGDVVKTKIAKYHWEIRGDGEFIPGNPNGAKVVALKTFKGVDSIRSRQEATEEFKIELSILKELRDKNTRHEMIMLNRGSITIMDYTQAPAVALSHSLIFELAECSLEDFLKDEHGFWRSTKKGLFACLVDIVEALACLHDKLGTFHLDIKPDNILIFKKQKDPGLTGPDLKERYELIWKLSDFGLARKKKARSKAGITNSSAPNSMSSKVPATRPAGLYQAPEIQQQDSSQAGQSSDVWSMGCVTLMVLAYMTNGSKEVSMLKSWLIVHFLEGGGSEPLFYVRKDSHPWDHRSSHKFLYLQDHTPEESDIPGTTPPLRAALNPMLIYWSNILLERYRARPAEQRLVQEAFMVIFRGVLRINPRSRSEVPHLHKKLSRILKDWKLYEDDSEYNLLYNDRSRGEQAEEPPGEARVLPSAEKHEITHLSLPHGAHGSSDNRHDTPYASQQDLVLEETLSIDKRAQIQERLYSAIGENHASIVKELLELDPGQLSRPWPSTKRYLLHWALFKGAYDAFDVLLQKSSITTTSTVCGKRTALALACELDKPEALECIRKHREKFEFPRDIYDRCKRNRGWRSSEAKKIVDDLFKSKSP